MENINQAVGAGMTEGEYSRNFSVKIILTCYIFECVEKVHLRDYGGLLERREDIKMIPAFYLRYLKG